MYGLTLTTVRSGKSPVHGLGCFALRPMADGERHGVPGFDFNEDQLPPEMVGYSFDVGHRNGKPRVFCPIGAHYHLNHSGDPNAEVVWDGMFLWLYALRPIAAGDEILIDYGADYWEVADEG